MKRKNRAGGKILAFVMAAALVFQFGISTTASAAEPDVNAEQTEDAFAVAEGASEEISGNGGSEEDPDRISAYAGADALSGEEAGAAGIAAEPDENGEQAEDAFAAAESFYEEISGDTGSDGDPDGISTYADADALSGEDAGAAGNAAEPDANEETLAEDPGEDTAETATEVSGMIEDTIFPDTDALADSDELFAEYVEKVFYGDGGIATLANYGPKILDERSLSLYEQLKEMITEVANGERTSTVFSISDVSALTWTAEELGSDSISTLLYAAVGDALNCLLVDCPYELYWFDKLAGMGFAYSTAYSYNSDGTLESAYVSSLTITLLVASAYQGDSDTTVNTAKTSAAMTAASNAQSIAAEYASYTDEEKVEYYKEKICELVSYDSAATDSSTPYGDPWQLVYVFDGDSSTNVVCEGYSKAFQYLCDIGLSDSTSYIVTGTMTGATGAGSHMWNVLSLDGCNYLVDVTNSDTGTVGANGGLFLVDDTDASYVNPAIEYDFTISGGTVTYTYNSDTISLYSESIRTLGSSHILNITEQPSDLTLTYGYAGATLSVAASTDSGVLSYQWYEKNADGTGTAIDGATEAAFTVPAGMAAGTTATYYCVVTHEIHHHSGSYEYDTKTSDDAVVTVMPKELTPSVSGTASKTYDGTTAASGLSISLDGIVSGDTVTASATYTYASSDVGTDITVQVTGITLGGADASNYTLSATSLATTGTITAKALTDSMVSLSDDSYAYTGKAVEPSVTVSDVVDGTERITSNDYETAYENNTSVGTAAVTVTGRGNYTGTVTKTFTITAADISECTVTLSEDVYEYDGSAKEPEVTVTNGSGVTLTEGTDYTVAYSGNTDVGTATVTVTGIGNYEGTLTAEFTIARVNISSGYTITLSDDAYIYDGTAKEPAVTVSNGSSVLNGDDYDVVYGGNVNAGTATVTVTGKGNCAGTITTVFTIGQREAEPSISGTTTKVYDGTTAAPADLTITLRNVIDGDDVSAAAAGYAYNSANVADADTITAYGITLSGSAKDNYVLSDDTASVAGSITKAEAVIEFASGYDPGKTYDGSAVSVPTEDDLELTGVAYEDILFEWYEGGTASGDPIAAPADAGTYTLSASAAGSSNYYAEEAVLTFVIGRAVYTPDELTKTVAADMSTSGVKVDISGLIQDGGTTGAPSADGELIDAGSLAAEDGSVTFDTTAQAAGTAATITIPVTGCTNYEDYEIIVAVTAKEVTVEVSGDILRYTGIPMDEDASVVTIKITGGSGIFAAVLTGEDWITNLPAGLSQELVRVDDTTVEIHIGGTAYDEFDEAFDVVIPAGSILGVDADLEETGGRLEIDEATYMLEPEGTPGKFADQTYGDEKGSSVTYTFKNTGNQPVTGIRAAAVNIGDYEPDPAFTVVVSADSAKPGETITVTVTSGAGFAHAGIYEGRLTLTWENAEDGLTEDLSQTVVKAGKNEISAVNTSKTYDGEPADVTAKADFGTPQYKWYDGGKELEEAPKDVGSYTVEIFVDETEDYAGARTTVNYEINPAAPSIVLGDKTERYTGSPIPMGDAYVILVNGENYDGEITYTYYADEACTRELDGAPSEIGTYYVTASVAAFGNYTAARSEAAKLSIVGDGETVETRYISGRKLWDDDNNKADARPDSIKVNLYQNGSEVPYASRTVTADDDWAWSWTVPMYDEDGNAYVYTIKEDEVDYYTPSYTAGSFDITNTFIGETGEEGAGTTASGTSTGGDNPETGDAGSFGIWLALLMAGAAGVLGASRMRKRI